ncbi:MAG: type III-A CRISPR-associated RAMP protein Csm5 [Actinomycetia bacterium]|nr:type III-A CRISPR-associated RAMP protein Csm5 [Actinomycetes bacterium]
MKFILETLSPLHIGTGERYGSSEFLVKGNNIIRLDINNIYALLSDKNKNIFLQFLEDPRFRLDDFIKNVDISILQAKLYSIKLKTNIPHEIVENIKTGFKGYVPGSTLKGAIRTAILSAFIGDNEIIEIGKIFTMKNPWKRNMDAERFLGRFLSTQSSQSSYSDLMRFVQISDFIPVKDLYVYNIQSLEAEGDKWKWYRRNGRIVQTYLETIMAGERLEGDIHFTYNEQMHKSLGLEYKSDIIDIIEIKRLIHSFSNAIINHEIDFSKRYEIDFLLEFYEKLKKINTEDSPVIKLGQGSGYLATTIGLELKKNPDVFEKVRKSLRGRSYSFVFPKTRRIVMEEKMPLGWCRII